MDKDLIKEQLDFVEWLKTQGMYDPMESADIMEKMFRVFIALSKSIKTGMGSESTGVNGGS